jgi:hypothetical protein
MSLLDVAIKHEFNQIVQIINQLLRAPKGLQRTRATQLFHQVLHYTRNELEDIYLQYIIKKQARARAHAKAQTKAHAHAAHAVAWISSVLVVQKKLHSLQIDRQ